MISISKSKYCTQVYDFHLTYKKPSEYLVMAAVKHVKHGNNTIVNRHYVLRHAQNQAGITRASEGQNRLPIGVLNKRLISYLGAGLSVTSKKL